MGLENGTAQRIAAAALHILEQEGPERVTMRRVAKAVGITPMAIYHHYPSRESLLKAVTDGEFSLLLRFLERRWTKSFPESRLMQLMLGYLDYAFARPRVFDYVFSRPRPGARRFPEDFRSRRSPTLNRVADAVAAAMQAGMLKKDDVWEVSLALWAHAHGYIALYRGERLALPEKEFRALYRRSLRRFLHGLAA